MASLRLENPYEVQQVALLNRIIGNVDKLNEAILELTKSLGEVNTHNDQVDALAEMWSAYSRNVAFNLKSNNELHPPK